MGEYVDSAAYIEMRVKHVKKQSPEIAYHARNIAKALHRCDEKI